jgi:hypothetical protein
LTDLRAESRVARWHIFIPKIPFLMYFERPSKEKFCILYGYLVYLRSFGVFCGILVYFHRFGVLYQNKSGNPGRKTPFFFEDISQRHH